jgi:carbon-monoxide dehydrogenase medium subunit
LRDGAWKETEFLVDVKGLEGTTQISFDPSSGLRIGSSVTLNKISCHPEVKAHYAVLAQACDTVAAYQLRNRATIIGNICNASPAGDTIGACLLYGGVLNVHGVDGVRQEPLATFFKGPGRTTLKPGDIVTSLILPTPPKGSAGKYIKLNRNKSGDLALVGVTALVYPNTVNPSGITVKMALASVAPIPLVLPRIEEYFMTHPLDEKTVIEAGQIAMDSCSPIDDVRGTARYRKQMVKNLAKQALQTLL